MKKNLLKVFKSCCFLCLMFFGVSVVAQSRITGKVTGDDKLPVAGASVVLKGTTNGTVTGSDGSFSINAKIGDVLSVTFIGYQPSQIKVTSERTVITLSSSQKSLNEVVVTGYASQKKKDLTGAVSIVNVEQLSKYPSSSVANQLQGQAAGVTVIGNGQPGQQPSIRIRGFSTFGNNNPLYVVDGVPTNNISDLNTDDISSFQILKDASASIYGARASNGVVIITTKKGSGKVKIVYDGYYGTQQPIKGNVFNLLNPQEMANLKRLATTNTAAFKNATPNYTDALYGNGAQYVLPDYIIPAGAKEGDPSVNPSLYNVNPNYTNPNDVSSFYRINRANKAGTDWYHELYKPAMTQKHNISVSGGSDQGSYLFSLNYYDQKGTLIDTYIKRFTLRANSSYNVNKSFRLGENVAYSATNSPTYYDPNNNSFQDNMEGSATGESFRMQPIVPVRDIRGNYAGTFGPGQLGNSINPVAIQERSRANKGLTNRLFGNVFAEADLLKGLTLRTSFGGEIYSATFHQFNYPTYENAENTPTNTFQQQHYDVYNWTWTNTLNYHLVSGKHDLKVVLGTEAYNNVVGALFAGNTGYFSFNPNYVNITTGTGTPTASSFQGSDAISSYIGRVDYNFADKYLIEATVRRDGSSRFLHYQTGYFPAVSAGWRISQEAFMKNVSWITDLKIRGGYGVLGNQINVAPSNSFSTYSQDKGQSFYDIGGTSTTTTAGLRPSQIGNPDAKWERDIRSNIGLDATLFKGALDFTVDYYKKDVKDLLYNPNLPGTAGQAVVPYVNIGKLTNHGIDASVSSNFHITDDLRFNGSATFTTFRTKILKISSGIDHFDQDSRRFNGASIIRNQVGQPIATYFGYKVAGFWNSQADINAANAAAQIIKKDPTAVYQLDAGVGRFRYADVTHQGFIDQSSRTTLGNPSPDYSYGINLGFTYRSWDLNAQFFGVQGNSIFNNVRWWTDFYPGFAGAKSRTALYDSWTPTHMNARAPIVETQQNFSNNQVPTSYYVENGSYFRMKNLQIGYSLPKAVLSSVGISRLRIYVSGSNLFTVTKYSGVDPEIGGGSTTDFGVDEGAYASAKTYLLGLNFSF